MISDGSARLNALISGQIDAINRVDHKAVALLSKSPKVQIVRAPGGWHAVMAMEIDKPPYDNPDIRLALKYAIDREQILKALFSGYGSLGNDHPIPPSDPYFNKELPQRKHDPERPRSISRRRASPIRRSCCRSRTPPSTARSTWARCSRRAPPRRAQDRSQEGAGRRLLGQCLAEGRVRRAATGAAAPAATQMLSVAYGAGAPWNETHWKNDKFEKLLADAKQRDRRGQAQALYLGDAGDAARRTAARSSPSSATGSTPINDKVGGHTPHGGFDMDNGYILEKAWLKA